MISCIPCISRGAAGVGHRRQIAVEIVGLGSGPKRQLLVIGIVIGRRQRRRHAGAGEGSTRGKAVPGEIVGVRQRAQRGRVLLVGHGREFRGEVVGKS